jgi:Tol biopolymer transport system component
MSVFRLPAVALLILALLGDGPAPSASQDPRPSRLPQAVRPFPPGLTGTLVFESDVAGRPAVYTLALATGTVAALVGGAAFTATTPRWSPDGSRIAFSSNRAHYEGASPDTGPPDMDLWVVNADGRGLARLTHDPANEHDPAWAPDGQSLVYNSDRDSRGDLFRLVLATGTVTRLTQHFVGRAIMPAPSPDGTRIAFAAQSLRAGAFWSYQVHLLAANGAAPALETTVGGCWPTWSHDGLRLAHVRLPANKASSIEVRSGARLEHSRVLQADGLWSYYPDFSPDGTRLAFSVSPAHHEGENWDLAVVDVASGAWTRLTQGAGNDRLPDWKR